MIAENGKTWHGFEQDVNLIREMRHKTRNIDTLLKTQKGTNEYTNFIIEGFENDWNEKRRDELTQQVINNVVPDLLKEPRFEIMVTPVSMIEVDNKLVQVVAEYQRLRVFPVRMSDDEMIDELSTALREFYKSKIHNNCVVAMYIPLVIQYVIPTESQKDNVHLGFLTRYGKYHIGGK